jgi:hypothetical protein
MSPKLPAKGTLKNTPATRLPDAPGPSRLPGNSTLPDVDRLNINPGGATSSVRHGGEASNTGTTSHGPAGSVTDLPIAQRELHDYWIPDDVTLPAPDPQGLRTYRGRPYVDLPDGHAVPVALDSQSGFYRVTQTGERVPSGPWLVRDRDNNFWKPLEDSPEILRIRSTEHLETEIARHIKTLDESHERLRQLKYAWRTRIGTEDEKSAIVRYEVQGHKHLAAVEKLVGFYTTEQRSLVIAHGARVFEKDWLNMNKDLLKIHSNIATISESRWMLNVPAHTEEHYRTTATYFKNRLALLRKSQIVADEILRISPEPTAVFAEAGYHPMDIHTVTASWVRATSLTLSAAHFAGVPEILSMSFSELVNTFCHVDSIPVEARLPVLSLLTDKCNLLKDSFEIVDTAQNPVHAAAREEIINVIRNFENTLEDRFAFYYRNLQSASSIPALEMVIDFDFPAQRSVSRPSEMPVRMFQSPDDPGEIFIGQTRRTAEGQELIDVAHPYTTHMVAQTYEHRNGQWRRFETTGDKTLASLTIEARQHLETTDEYLRRAHHAGVIERPRHDYRKLDDLRLRLEHVSIPATDDTALLVRRLTQTSQRLRKADEEARIHRFKNDSFLSTKRVAFLLSHDRLRVKQEQTRMEHGEGQHKEFLDIYSLDDELTGRPLWKAHFHYARKDSPALDFKPHGGHLGSLQDAAAGIFFRRQDEQPGRPLNEVWELTFDEKTAQKIFDLAS